MPIHLFKLIPAFETTDIGGQVDDLDKNKMAEAYYSNYFGERLTIRLGLIVNPRHEIGLILLTIYQ